MLYWCKCERRFSFKNELLEPLWRGTPLIIALRRQRQMGQPGLQSKCKARLEYSETNLKKKKKGNWLEVKMQTVLA